MTTADWIEVKLLVKQQIANHLKTGQFLKREITVEGDSVSFKSLKEAKEYLIFVDEQIVESETGVKSSAGFRSVAVFNGNGLK